MRPWIRRYPFFFDFCPLPRRATKLGSLQGTPNPKNINCVVSPRSPKCNFMIRPCKPKWIERTNTRLKHQSEQLLVAEKTTKGGGALKHPAPFVGLSVPKFFELLLKVSYLFLSIHFGLQGRIIKLHFGDLGLT